MRQTAIQEKVARGAVFMDRNRPGWEHDIKLDLLDIGCSEMCVLGQIFNNYGIGTKRMGIIENQRLQYALGFMAIPKGNRGQYPQLTVAWKIEVIARRAKHSLRKNHPVQKPRRRRMCVTTAAAI